eukprot:224501-Chlamydomonas_euryale.AAC.1
MPWNSCSERRTCATPLRSKASVALAPHTRTCRQKGEGRCRGVKVWACVLGIEGAGELGRAKCHEMLTSATSQRHAHIHTSIHPLIYTNSVWCELRAAPFPACVAPTHHSFHTTPGM